MSDHWHLTVVRKGGEDLWCGDSFDEVKQTLASYNDAASINVRILRNGRGGVGSQWCRKATRMEKVPE